MIPVRSDFLPIQSAEIILLISLNSQILINLQDHSNTGGAGKVKLTVLKKWKAEVISNAHNQVLIKFHKARAVQACLFFRLGGTCVDQNSSIGQ